MNFHRLYEDDIGYALFTWREGHKKAPGVHRLPWAYYKDVVSREFEKILDDASTRLIGAYQQDPMRLAPEKLVGWIAATPGKRVHTLHWVHVKHELDGVKLRRQGVMMQLIDAAELGSRFVYTLRARRDRALLPDGNMTKSLDESLVAALRARGVTATYVPLREWLK